MAALLFFVSGHGFGHAVRAAQVVKALAAEGTTSVIATSAPRWIFEANLPGIPFGYRQMATDEGVAQIDSLHVDLPSTYRRWQRFMAREAQWLDDGLALLRETDARGIVADIAPLALPLARRAGLPSLLIATFTWDWILDYYRDEEPGFLGISQWLRGHYLKADAMVSTPFAYGLPPVAPLHTVPLIAKKAAAGKAAIRRRLGFDDMPHYFLSFGGCGVNNIDRMRLEKMPDRRFVFLDAGGESNGNIIHLASRQAVHEEVVAACDAVIGKPGYGTVAECVLNRTPMVYTERGRFAEYNPMVEEMREYIPTVHIPQEALFSGELPHYLDRIPPFTAAHKTDPGNGAQQAAAIIRRRFGL